MNEKQQEINELTGEYHADVNLLIERINELKARVELLRDELAFILFHSGTTEGFNNRTKNLLAETPTQSINYIKAQVEEQSDACSYPDCRCPFDAHADSNWCAKGLRK